MFYVTLCAYLGVFSLEMFPSVHDLPVYIVTHKSGWISTFCLLWCKIFLGIIQTCWNSQ